MSAAPVPRHPAETRSLPPETVRTAIDWMLRLQSRERDLHGRQALQARCREWRDGHPDHELAWQRMLALQQDLAETFGQLPHAGAAAGAIEAASRQVGRRQALKLLSFALAGGLPALWLAERTRPWQPLLADHATTTGERRLVQLDDGSRLLLNTGSLVSIRFSNSQRLVVLTRGEIMLASGPDSAAPVRRPLRVLSSHGLFEALGTRFIVRQDETSTLLNVEEGAVAIRPALRTEQPPAAIARAGESWRVRPDGMVSDPSPALDPGAWQQGMIVARDLRLDAFLAEISRYRSGHVGCDASIGGLLLSGVFQLGDTDRLLAILPHTLPVRVEQRTRWWVSVRPATA